MSKPDLYFHRININGRHVLAPANRQALEAIQRYPTEDVIAASVRRPRNGAFHRKYWALLEAVMRHIPESMELTVPTIDRLHWHMKTQTGRFDVVTTLGGKEQIIPHSISFSKMSEDEFARFYDDCIAVIVKHIIPGISDDKLRALAEDELLEFAA